MTHASLFSGIGGFDLAAEWMGWDNLFHCEWNKFGQQVLKHHFPNSKSYEDITKTDFSIHRGTIDILTGGFPCQPYSSAGKRLGKEDERHLFPEMLRAIQEIQPRWIVGENVFGIVNWGGGVVFEEVQTLLELEGYEVQAYVLPAASVNAPHKRDRVWFVAYSDNDATNSNKIGLSTKMENRELGGDIGFTKCNQRNVWDSFPTKSPICGGDDGIPTQLDSISIPKWRNESIKAYGNAIVPQVAHQIFKAIQQYDTNHSQANS
jgi:DNA (cytosine-5)-methyltransferase 1